MKLRSLSRRLLTLCSLLLVCLSGALAQEPRQNNTLPIVYLIGDSTVRNGTAGQQGWGDPLIPLFDPAKVRIINRARGGRSSRTYLTEGLWDAVEKDLRPGDYVLIQFGHNDGGSPTTGRRRASLKGVGDDTLEVTDPESGKKETVQTYGWYLKRYIAEARAKGAIPIVLSPVPRNIWKDGQVARAASDYGRWAREAAQAGGALFLDLNEWVAKRYEKDGEALVRAQYFGEKDHTHTTPAGAKVTAETLAEALKALPDCRLKEFLR